MSCRYTAKFSRFWFPNTEQSERKCIKMTYVLLELSKFFSVVEMDEYLFNKNYKCCFKMTYVLSKLSKFFSIVEMNEYLFYKNFKCCSEMTEMYFRSCQNVAHKSLNYKL